MIAKFVYKTGDEALNTKVKSSGMFGTREELKKPTLTVPCWSGSISSCPWASQSDRPEETGRVEFHY